MRKYFIFNISFVLSVAIKVACEKIYYLLLFRLSDNYVDRG